MCSSQAINGLLKTWVTGAGPDSALCAAIDDMTKEEHLFAVDYLTPSVVGQRKKLKALRDILPFGLSAELLNVDVVVDNKKV